jgi:hypothetical protein
MEKNKTGKSMGSEGRHIGATGPTLGRGHSRSIEEHQDAGSSDSQQQKGGQHDGSHAPERERSDRPQRKE